MLHFCRDPRCCWSSWSKDHTSRRVSRCLLSTATCCVCFVILLKHKSTNIRWHWDQENPQHLTPACQSPARWQLGGLVRAHGFWEADGVVGRHKLVWGDQRCRFAWDA